MAVTINGDGVVDVGGNASSAAYVRLYEDSDNGTNYVDLIAPSSVASNRTLTMPDASGVIDRLNRAGNVLQVVSTTKTDTFTTTSTSFTTITGLTASITPSSATSKIMIFVSVTGSEEYGVNDALIGLFRDSTQIALGDADGSRIQYSFMVNQPENGWVTTGSTNFLDSPNTTSAISYSVRARVPSSGTLYINRSKNDSNAISGAGRPVSSITVMEIAG